MAKPMRRSADGLGGEPCTRSTWCRDASPGSSSRYIAFDSSTATMTSWPRVSRLLWSKVSRCGSCSRLCEPGMTPDRKSTRLNSSHLVTSYAVFCLKKKMGNLGICNDFYDNDRLLDNPAVL